MLNQKGYAKVFTILVIILLTVIATAAVTILVMQNIEKKTEPVETKEAVTTTKTYTNKDYRYLFSYDSKYLLSEHDSSFQTLLYAPESRYCPERTDCSQDRIEIEVVDNPDNLEIKAWAKKNWQSTNFDENTKYQDITISGTTGISYTVEGLGEFNYTLLPLKGKVLQILGHYLNTNATIKTYYPEFVKSIILE